MKWTKLTLLVGVIGILSAGEARAERPEAPDQASGADEKPFIQDYKTRDPVLMGASEVTTSSECPYSGIVAFSVTGTYHVSTGAPTLLGYQSTYTLYGGGWTAGGGTFIAPCAGLYVFTVSFVKDAYYYGGSTDDIFIHITRNGMYTGYAWSGEGSGNRGTGTYTVTLILNPGDYVQTFVASDGNVTRHLARYNFTGYLVKPL